MLVIRFLRVGRKRQPSYKIVVTDKKNPPRAGRFVEQVGYYNPLTKEKVLKGERIKYWLSVGAKPSDTVFNLFVSEKIIEGKKIPKHKPSKKQKEEKPSEQIIAEKEVSLVEVKKEEPKTEKKLPEKDLEKKDPVLKPDERPAEVKPAIEEKKEPSFKEKTEKEPLQ